jgi:hypothetical protein
LRRRAFAGHHGNVHADSAAAADETFDVVILAFEPREESPQLRLQSAFGIDAAAADKLVAKLPMTVQRAVPRVRAEYFRRALILIGASSEVRSQDGQVLPEPPPPPPPAEPPRPETAPAPVRPSHAPPTYAIPTASPLSQLDDTHRSPAVGYALPATDALLLDDPRPLDLAPIDSSETDARAIDPMSQTMAAVAPSAARAAVPQSIHPTLTSHSVPPPPQVRMPAHPTAREGIALIDQNAAAGPAGLRGAATKQVAASAFAGPTAVQAAPVIAAAMPAPAPPTHSIAPQAPWKNVASGVWDPVPGAAPPNQAVGFSLPQPEPPAAASVPAPDSPPAIVPVLQPPPTDASDAQPLPPRRAPADFDLARSVVAGNGLWRAPSGGDSGRAPAIVLDGALGDEIVRNVAEWQAPNDESALRPSAQPPAGEAELPSRRKQRLAEKPDTATPYEASGQPHASAQPDLVARRAAAREADGGPQRKKPAGPLPAKRHMDAPAWRPTPEPPTVIEMFRDAIGLPSERQEAKPMMLLALVVGVLGSLGGLLSVCSGH